MSIYLFFIPKHSAEKEYLVANAGKIFSGMENFSEGEQRTQLTEILASYFLYVTKLNKKDMNQINAQLPPETTQTFESTAQRLIREGKIEGKIEGDIKLLIKNINFCLSLMTRFPDLSLEEIANISSTKLPFVKKLQTGFKEGDEKKAREIVLSFFKKYKKLKGLYLKETELIFTKYVPLFTSMKKQRK